MGKKWNKFQHVILAMLTSFGLYYSLRLLFESILKYVVKREIWLGVLFPRLLLLIQILANGVIGYLIYKKIKISETYSKSLIIFIIINIISLIVLFLMKYIF